MASRVDQNFKRACREQNFVTQRGGDRPLFQHFFQHGLPLFFTSDKGRWARFQYFPISPGPALNKEGRALPSIIRSQSIHAVLMPFLYLRCPCGQQLQAACVDFTCRKEVRGIQRIVPRGYLPSLLSQTNITISFMHFLTGVNLKHLLKSQHLYIPYLHHDEEDQCDEDVDLWVFPGLRVSDVVKLLSDALLGPRPVVQ